MSLSQPARIKVFYLELHYSFLNTDIPTTNILMPHGKQTKTVAAERAFRMYMDAIKQNPEQIIRESKFPFYKGN